MIEFFRRGSPFNIIFLFLYTIALHVYLYVKPFDPTHIHIASPAGYFLFQWLWGLPFKITWLIATLTIIMSFANALVLNYTLNYYKLMSQFSFLPAFIFITMSACIPGFDLFSPEVLTCFFLLWAIHKLLGIYKTSHATGVFFDIGLMLSVACLLVPAYWVMVLFIYVSLLLLRPFALLEWGATALGLFIPVLLCGTVFFVMDKLPLFVTLIEPEFQHWPRYTFIYVPIKQLLPAAFILVTAITAGLSIQRYLPKMVVQLRTYFNVYLRLLFFVCIMNALHRSNGLQHYMLLVVPFSIPISYVLARRKRLLWIDVWWLSIIILMVIMPYIR